jgi:hypothetical protein
MACLCSQISTEKWILHITDQQKNELQHRVAETLAATRSGTNNEVALWSCRNRKKLNPLFTKSQADSSQKVDDYSQADGLHKADDYRKADNHCSKLFESLIQKTCKNPVIIK